MLPEPESEPLIRQLRACERVVSIAIARVEVERALRRVVRGAAPAEKLDRIFRSLETRSVTEDLVIRAARLEPPALRTLDALHLACALELGPELDAFLCYDSRLAAAARQHGLAVLSPGAGEIHEP